MFNTPRLRALLAAAIALIVAVPVTIVIVDNGPGHDTGQPRRTVTIHVGGTPTVAPAPAGELQTRDATELRDDTPSDVPATTLRHADQAEEKTAAPLPAVTDPLPVGGAQGYSCRVHYAPAGYGNRTAGAKVMSFKLHYTVSPNLTGWGDVVGVGDYLARVGLSAHLIVDFEGHCLQRVPWAKNAWTEGAFNSTSESVEIIATGRETRAQWLASPLFRKAILAAIVRDRLRARGLPLRFVDPQGCADRLGYTDHNHLECGNNHSDVAPTCAGGRLPLYPLSTPLGCTGFPFDVFQRQLADGPKPATITDRVTCRKIQWWRAHGRPHGKPETNAVRRRRALAKRHVTCTSRGPVRR